MDSNEFYNERIESQNHKCLLCGRHGDDFISKFAIYRHPETLTWLGLICEDCALKIKINGENKGFKQD